MSLLNKTFQFTPKEAELASKANINFDDVVSFANGQYEGDLFYNVKSYGAVGDGSTNDTAAINLAITAANAGTKPLFFPPGTYTVTPGGLSEINVSIFASEAFFEAADATDSPLLTIRYNVSRAATNSSPTAYICDVAGVVGNSSGATTGTGLYVKESARNYFRVRQANWLKYGVHFDTSWKTGAPMPTIFENYGWFKLDSCTVGLQISTHNDNAGVAIDSNYFYMGSSFNHFTACVRISAGTDNFNQVYDNVFEHEMLEIGQTDSNGIVLTGKAINNQFIIHNQRGINGAGKYATTDTNATNNFFKIYTWVPGNWSFTNNQQVHTMNALDGTNNQQGRSRYWAPDVATAVSTTIPSIVGDTIYHSDPGIGDNFAWVCTTAGTPGTWTPLGMKSTVICGGTDTVGLTAGTTQYISVSGRLDNNTSANNANDVMPVNGTLRNFYVRTNAAAGAAKTVTFTLVKNNSLTAIVLTISGASATTANDTSSTLSIAKGDTLCWEIKDTVGSTAGLICAASFELLVDPS